MSRHYVLVTGGRDYRDYESMHEIIRFLTCFYEENLRVLHGAARGADALAQRAIERFEVPFKQFPADWNGPCHASCDPGHRRPRGNSSYCPAAGVLRNVEMAEYLDFCRDHGHSTQVLAFPGGSGTMHMVQEAASRGHPVDQVS
jgi:hypothetical protein